MTANEPTAREGHEPDESNAKQPTNMLIETVGGEAAVAVTINGLGHEASPELVSEVEWAIQTEVGHLVEEQADAPGSTYTGP